MEDETNDTPSFGALIAAKLAEEVIDVDEALDDPRDHLKTLLSSPQHPAVPPPPSANSLGTVLNQALKTNDVQLLESCLHITDITTVRSTIQRLDSSLATRLLSKLAERMHRRPGRAGNLMVWIQWTIVCHGGHLASQPDLMHQLAELYEVIKVRASGLQPLLNLKGKLDMLEAQMQLRRSMQTSTGGYEQVESEDDERIIYVEGQDDVEDDRIEQGPVVANPDVDMADASTDEEEDEDEDEDMPPTTNGVIDDSEAETGMTDSEGEALVDDEAEETDADTVEDTEDDPEDDPENEDVELDHARSKRFIVEKPQPIPTIKRQR